MHQSERTIKKVSKQHSDADESILVRSTNWLGDAVMTLPALNALRRSRPRARISVLTRPSLAPLFESTGVVDDVLIYDRGGTNTASAWISFLKMARRLSRYEFDTALLFQGAFEAALLVALARIPSRVGYASQGRRFLLTTPLEKPGNRLPTHETLNYLAIVDAATGQPTDIESPSNKSPEDIRPVLTASEKQRTAAVALLAMHGVSPGEGSIAILNPGATNSRAKRWPESHFAELADELADATGCRVVIVGSQSEREIATRIISFVKGNKPINIAGLTDLSTLIGVLSRASVVVSNDTGTAHVAAALGRPTLTLFGPTNELETAPLGRMSQIVRAPGIDCERCMLRECPIDHRCMVRILPVEVVERAQRLLRKLE